MIHMATDPLGARAATHGLPHLKPRSRVPAKPRSRGLAGDLACPAHRGAAAAKRPR